MLSDLGLNLRGIVSDQAVYAQYCTHNGNGAGEVAGGAKVLALGEAEDKGLENGVNLARINMCAWTTRTQSNAFASEAQTRGH